MQLTLDFIQPTANGSGSSVSMFTLLNLIVTTQRSIMASIQDLETKIGALTQAVADEQTRTQAALDAKDAALADKSAALVAAQAALAAAQAAVQGTDVPQADLDAIDADIQKLAAQSPAPVAPVETPVA